MAGPKPFLERLDAGARELLLSVARPVSFVKGARLVRQGEAARGAFVLRKGRAEAAVALPGGERHVVAKLGPGNVFGEMALVERGTVTATVSATANLDGWFLEREDFRALIAQREPAALRVQHALTLILADKLRAINAKVLDVAAPEDKPAPKADASDPLAGVKRARKASFDFRPFLNLLPVFEGFDASEIEEVVSVSKLLELPAGHEVFRVGQPSDACFIIVRGAVEVSAVHSKRVRRMAVLGPGQMFGFMSLLDGGVHGSLARAREAVLLLELPRKAFEGLYWSQGPVSTRLQRAIQQSLLLSLAQTNRHLTRLISMALLRGAKKEGEELESAYGGQIVAGQEPAQA